jgi:hypothetical protein
MEARDEKRLLKLQAQLAAVKLLIIDELVPSSGLSSRSSHSSARSGIFRWPRFSGTAASVSAGS